MRQTFGLKTPLIWQKNRALLLRLERKIRLKSSVNPIGLFHLVAILFLTTMVLNRQGFRDASRLLIDRQDASVARMSIDE